MLTDYIINLLTILTLLGDIFIALSIIRLFAKGLFPAIAKEIHRHNHALAFIVALTAASGSLFFSEVMGYVPCELCWFQRIFMYPLPIILLVSLIKNDRSVKKYVLPLAVIGGCFSAYHYTIQRLSIQTSCSATGPACTTVDMFALGYITIPMMALTASIMIIVLLTAFEKH